MTIDYGTLVRIRRKEFGLTQRQVADMACCHRQTVGALENNAKSINTDCFLSILEALGLKLVVEEDEEISQKLRELFPGSDY